MHLSVERRSLIENGCLIKPLVSNVDEEEL